MADSGNHVADKQGDFAVWITIDARPCRAFRGVIHQAGEKSQVKCMMAIEVGKNFRIHVDTTGFHSRRYQDLLARHLATSKPPLPPLDTSGMEDLEVRLSIDGRWIATHVIGAQARDRVTSFKGAAISDTAVKVFKFIDPRAAQVRRPPTGRAPPTTPPSKSAEIGTIKISIHRVRRGEPTSPWIPGKLNAIKPSSEEARQHGAITAYEQPQRLLGPEKYFIVRRMPNDKTTPLCSFEIAYHTPDELRALGIAVPTSRTRPHTGTEPTFAYRVQALPRPAFVIPDVAMLDPIARPLDGSTMESMSMGLLTPRSSY